MPKRKTLIDLDPWLEPHGAAIIGRRDYIEQQIQRLLDGRDVKDFALGHLYFGLHRMDGEWVFREWAPNATKIVLVGDFNEWKETPEYELIRKGGGIFEITLPLAAMSHRQKYKLHI